jgi:hypothetical protein
MVSSRIYRSDDHFFPDLVCFSLELASKSIGPILGQLKLDHTVSMLAGIRQKVAILPFAMIYSGLNRFLPIIPALIK